MFRIKKAELRSPLGPFWVGSRSGKGRGTLLHTTPKRAPASCVGLLKPPHHRKKWGHRSRRMCEIISSPYLSAAPGPHEPVGKGIPCRSSPSDLPICGLPLPGKRLSNL